MGVNKVEANGKTLIDLTKDSVTPKTLAEGVTAHDASGEQIVGTMSLNNNTSIKYSEGLAFTPYYAGGGYQLSGIGTCTDIDIIIPPTYNGQPVISIADGVFYGCTINSVFIPKSVVSIYDPFFGCEGLTTIYCEAETQPDSWYPDWQLSYNADVVWGYVIPSNSGGSSQPCFEMPQIRFTGANGYAPDGVTTFYVDEENPLKLTVEIVGGGALQVGDALQICTRKRFNGSEANGYKRKYKLKRFAEYFVTEADLNKRYLTVATHTPDPGATIPSQALFRDGKGNGDVLSPLYLRIRRPKGDMQNNESGQTVDAEFSNIVAVWKTHMRSFNTIKIL